MIIGYVYIGGNTTKIYINKFFIITTELIIIKNY